MTWTSKRISNRKTEYRNEKYPNVVVVRWHKWDYVGLLYLNIFIDGKPLRIAGKKAKRIFVTWEKIESTLAEILQ